MNTSITAKETLNTPKEILTWPRTPPREQLCNQIGPAVINTHTFEGKGTRPTENRGQHSSESGRQGAGRRGTEGDSLTVRWDPGRGRGVSPFAVRACAEREGSRCSKLSFGSHHCRRAAPGGVPGDRFKASEGARETLRTLVRSRTAPLNCDARSAG